VIALALGAIACTVQKKEDAASAADTTAVPSQLPAAAAPAGAEPVMPDSVTTSASKERTRTSAKTPRKTSAGGDSVKPKGGERDSATQPMFQIGPDGKLHPIKR
jgi:hypothetical protein